MYLNSIEILQILNNHNHTQKNSEKMFSQKINEFQSRKLAFDWLHAGTLSLTINDLSQLIAKLSILPTRTGHLGNWQEIAEGRGSALEHNGIVCGIKKLAYPLIIDINQTENESMDSGDVVYLPGSVISNGQREKLIINTWNGNHFKRRNRDVSYFSPFTLAEIEGELIPITSIHRKHILRYPNAKYVSSLFIENKDFIKNILVEILNYVIYNKDCKLKLNDVFDRTVSLDGLLARNEIRFLNGGFKIGNSFYSNMNQLIDAVFLPFYAAHNPKDFFNHIKEMPSEMPFLSLGIMSTFPCLLNTCFNNLNFQPKENKPPFLPYFEWGAFDSAGYPPKSKGYFREKATAIREIYKIIVQAFPNIIPAMFILLPSAIFNLLPCDAYENDIEIVDELIKTALEQTHAIKSSASDILMKNIESITYNWFIENKNFLSPYYINKFKKARSIYQQKDCPEKSNPVYLKKFDELTLQKACMVMGTLREIIIKENE